MFIAFKNGKLGEEVEVIPLNVEKADVILNNTGEVCKVNATGINVLDKGVNLSKIGINGYGYSWEYIDDVPTEIEKLHLIILGGDVYSFGDNGLMLTFDNWYYNLKNIPSDSTLSVNKAKEFIHDYVYKNGEKYYFSFIFK